MPAGGCLEEDSVQLESRSHYTRLCSPLGEREREGKKGRGRSPLLLAQFSDVPTFKPGEGEGAFSPAPFSTTRSGFLTISPPLSLSLSPCPPFASCLLWFQSRLHNTKLLLALAHMHTHSLQALYVFWSNLLLAPPPLLLALWFLFSTQRDPPGASCSCDLIGFLPPSPPSFGGEKGKLSFVFLVFGRRKTFKFECFLLLLLCVCLWGSVCLMKLLACLRGSD